MDKKVLSDNKRRFMWIIGAFLFILAVGSAGYMLIEGYGFLDALYMTVITLSTVGYAEVHPLSEGGRIFTIFVVIGGVGFFFYAFTTLIQYFVESQLSNRHGGRRMMNKISQLRGHVILCGYGRVGREVARTLAQEGTPFVAIDGDSETVDRAVADGFLCIHGNASKDDVLNEAGIGRARALIAAVGNDADNIYITFSAKVLRPELLVVARGSDEESEVKLKRAGADRTILPLSVSGKRMAMLALHPAVLDFIETTMQSRTGGVLLEDVKVEAGSSLDGRTVGDVRRQGGGLSVLALRKREGLLISGPAPEVVLEPGDELITIATGHQLQSMEGAG